MSGAHTSEKRWYQDQNPNGNAGLSLRVQQISQKVLEALLDGEEAYKEMLELVAFINGTDQDLADQLFLEKWQARGVAGEQAVIEVDVTSGEVSNPVITTAGTGYSDGTGYSVVLAASAGGGDGLATLIYNVIGGAVTSVIVSVAGSTYDDGTGIVVTEMPLPQNQVPETEANATELNMVVDAKAAVTSIHELYQALTNQTVAQEDRIAALRRMS
jgi:hypothetical protein